MIKDQVLNYLNKKYPSGFKGIMAIDGRCASGKTTLANELKDELNATIIRMDDFFLRSEQRTQERYQEIGGNVDRERILDEILIPWKNHQDIIYRPFDCNTMSLKDTIIIGKPDCLIIEGSYSFHPALRDYYDEKIYLDIDPQLQIERLRKRNEKKLQQFIDRWIPLEEKYFKAYDFKAIADYCPDVGLDKI